MPESGVRVKWHPLHFLLTLYGDLQYLNMLWEVICVEIRDLPVRSGSVIPPKIPSV